MEKKILLAAGGIAAAALAVFLILGQGATRTLVAGSQSANTTQPAPQDLGVMIKNVTVTPQDDTHAKVTVVFAVTNPNIGTAIVENVHYTLSVNNYRMTSGDTGEVLEGFYGSQATTITIVPKTTVAIKDSQVATKNNVTASSWDNMVQGKAKYTIDGWYAVRTTASLQTNYQEKNFNLSYPSTA